MDFGHARPAPADAMLRTGTGAAMGTPAYMAPEQWWGAGVTDAADRYGLGATAFELLTGAPPSRRARSPELVRAHLHDAPPTLAAARGTAVPAAVEAWVARCLAKDPADRFASTRAMIDAGDAVFGGPRPAPRRARGRSSPSRPSGPPRRPRLRRVARPAGVGAARGVGRVPARARGAAGAVALATRASPGALPVVALAALAARRGHGLRSGRGRAPPRVPDGRVRALQPRRRGGRHQPLRRGRRRRGLALGLAARDPTSRGGDRGTRRRADLVALASVALALVAAASGVASPALVALACALANALLPAPRERPEALRAGALAVGAVALASVAAVARAGGAAARVWSRGWTG
ncbi:MAG: hypothetical protein U0325_35660 [Polyangiales bacterium]